MAVKPNEQAAWLQTYGVQYSQIYHHPRRSRQQGHCMRNACAAKVEGIRFFNSSAPIPSKNSEFWCRPSRFKQRILTHLSKNTPVSEDQNQLVASVLCRLIMPPCRPRPRPASSSHQTCGNRTAKSPAPSGLTAQTGRQYIYSGVVIYVYNSRSRGHHQSHTGE